MFKFNLCYSSYPICLYLKIVIDLSPNAKGTPNAVKLIY